MSDLSDRRCRSCEEGTPTLTPEQAAEWQRQIDSSWTVEDGRYLRRELKFGNFRDAFAYATRVAAIAESENHHPDLEVGWGRVGIVLTTHAAGGLTENDYILAAKIDQLEGRP